MSITRDIAFDAEKHLYRVDGVVWPGNTEILRAEGFVDERWFNEEASAFGTAVHDCCAANDLGFLTSPTADVAVRVDAWRAFLSENKVEIVQVEERVCHETLRYCGTLDRIVRIKGRLAVVDLKTGSRVPATALQLAGYAMAWHEPLKRCAVYLGENGRYKLDEHTERSDYRIFENAATNYWWKREHGIYQKEEA